MKVQKRALASYTVFSVLLISFSILTSLQFAIAASDSDSVGQSTDNLYKSTKSFVRGSKPKPAEFGQTA